MVALPPLRLRSVESSLFNSAELEEGHLNLCFGLKFLPDMPMKYYIGRLLTCFLLVGIILINSKCERQDICAAANYKIHTCAKKMQVVEENYTNTRGRKRVIG
jgi:hypothetical protein